MSEFTPLLALKSHYRSGKDKLGADFFGPCLKHAMLYRRAAGYFSSTALLAWADALPEVILSNATRIKLIASKELSATDLAVFKSLADEAKREEYRSVMVNKVLEEIVEFTEHPDDQGVRARLLAWLVANDRLDMRFAFPRHVEEADLFHEKIGIFDLTDGTQVAFTGSANESFGGHRKNYESIDVYLSWVERDEDRVKTKVEQFDEAWNNKAEGLDVKRPTAEVVARLKARAPSSPRSTKKPSPPPEDRRWRHQTEAVEAFLQARAGVLEMATGTGKTRTALKILDRLIDSSAIEAAVVSMEGTDLLDQWATELQGWNISAARPWRIYQHYESHKELGEFSLDPHQAILIVSRGQLSKVLSRLSDAQKEKMIIVHDEVHGLGVPSLLQSLKGQHQKFGWRLGLSATPERPYSQEGNDFLRDEIGPTIFSFPLELAIQRGVLSGFDYEPLPYDLTDGDRQRLKDVYSKEAARKREGNPMTQEELWTAISLVYKTAEMKPEVFFNYVKDKPDVLKNAIIFVETKEYGNAMLDRIHAYTTLYRTYYAEDDRAHLVAFARGEIDCLMTCHRISQGIDIQALQNVILFSSARSKLETIQRIGRCLRVDPANPNKRARVLDFVRPANPTDKVPNADQDRCVWLTGLSQHSRVDDA